MNRFYILTLQWPNATGMGMHTVRDHTLSPRADEAFAEALAAAHRGGAPHGANVIFFYLEDPK